MWYSYNKNNIFIHVIMNRFQRCVQRDGSLTFSSHLKSKVGHILTKVVTLRINLNINGASTDSPTPSERLHFLSRSHTHPSHSQTSLQQHRIERKIRSTSCSLPSDFSFSSYRTSSAGTVW